MLCLNCKSEISEKGKFCTYCGQEVGRCPFCKHVMRGDLEICPFCHRTIRERVSGFAKNEKQKEQKKKLLGGMISVLKNLWAPALIILFIALTWNMGGHTPPEEVLQNTNGEFATKPYTNPSLESYVSSIERVSWEEEIVRELRRMARGYHKITYYLEPCRNKKTKISFESPQQAEFNFNYGGNTFNYSVILYSDLYSFSKRLKSQDCYFEKQNDMAHLLKDPYNNYFVEAVASDFITLKNEGYSNDEIAEIATIFVQSIPYGNDGDEPNWYPYEVFYKNKGNCLDKSVILAKILKDIGYTAYIVLGDAGEYHALVGIVCEEGNVTYGEENICFIETTYFEPIGTQQASFSPEKYVKISGGELVYFGSGYGKEVARGIADKEKSIEGIILKTSLLEKELTSLQGNMCNTDCETCLRGQDGWYEIISSRDRCYDANLYNYYANQYEEKIEKHDAAREDLYRLYYDLEKSLFWNI